MKLIYMVRDGKNLVLNDILCFLASRIDSLTQPVLVKAISDTYEYDEIVKAKDVLFDNCSKTASAKKRKWRNGGHKGTNKIPDTINDVIGWLHDLSADEIPDFVSRGLKVPPVDAKNFDLSAVLIELRTLSSKVDKIQNMQCLIDELQLEIAKMKSNLNDQLNNDFPILVPDTPVFSSCQSCTVPKTLFSDVVNATPVQIRPTTTLRAAPIPQRQGIKKQMKAIIGNATKFVDKLTSVRTYRPLHIFVTRLSPLTECDDIVSFMKSEHEKDVTCEKLKTKFDTYSSFKVSTTYEHSELVMSPDSWPKGILIRKYFEPKARNPTTTNDGSNQ